MGVLLWLLFVLLYMLVTLFGLGPVLFADGSDRERAVTLTVVVLIYAALTVLLRMVMKRRRRH